MLYLNKEAKQPIFQPRKEATMGSFKEVFDLDNFYEVKDDGSPLANSELNNKKCLECGYLENCLFKSNKSYCLENFDKTDFPLEILFSPSDLLENLLIAQQCESLSIFTIEGLRIDDIVNQYKKNHKLSIVIKSENEETYQISLLKKGEKIPEETLKILNDFMGIAK